MPDKSYEDLLTELEQARNRMNVLQAQLDDSAAQLARVKAERDSLVKAARFFLVDPDDENYRAPLKHAIEQSLTPQEDKG